MTLPGGGAILAKELSLTGLLCSCVIRAVWEEATLKWLMTQEAQKNYTHLKSAYSSVCPDSL